MGLIGSSSSSSSVSSSSISTALGGSPVLASSIGSASGVAPLDSGGKVPVANLPSTVMEYKGVWNPSTNTPALSNGMSGVTGGTIYNVSVSGTQLGLQWNVGDWAIYNGTMWERSPASSGWIQTNGTIASVVQLTSAAYAALPSPSSTTLYIIVG